MKCLCCRLAQRLLDLHQGYLSHIPLDTFSVNDDRCVEQAMNNIGTSRRISGFNIAKEQAKAPGTEWFQAFFFAFLIRNALRSRI
jgi:hypothetical protein